MALIFLCIFVLQCWSFDITGFTYNQHINITSSQNYTMEDILVVMDTKKLYEEFDILEDCSDVAFVRNSTGELISHYMENSCNQENTRFYLTMNISTITEENKVTMYFRHANMSSVAEEFDGSFYVFKNHESNICGNGWKRDAEFDGRFPFIDSTEAGKFSSINSYGHSHFMIYFSEKVSDNSMVQESDYKIASSVQSTHVEHTHVFVGDSSESSNEQTLPKYKEHLFCKNSKLDFSKGSIGLFMDKNFQSNFSDYSEKLTLKERFERPFVMGGFNGNSGGFTTHLHKVEQDTYHTDAVVLMSNTWGYNYYHKGHTPCSQHSVTFGTDKVSNSKHTHRISSSSSAASNIPQNHVDFIFGINEEDNNPINEETQMFYISDKVPPKGFIKTTQYDGNFLHSGETFFDSHIQGTNKVSHTHDFTMTLDQAVQEGVDANIFTPDDNHYEGCSRVYYFLSGYSYSWENQIFSTSVDGKFATKKNHIHPQSVFQTTEDIKELPIKNIMLLTRKPKIANVFVEETVNLIGDIFERIPTPEPEPICDPICLNGGKCVLNGTDIFGEEIYVCECTKFFKGLNCSEIIQEGGADDDVVITPFDPTFIIVMGTVLGTLFILGVCMVAVVILIVTAIVIKKKKNREYSVKMIDSLVSGIDKEQELQDQKDQLEEEKIKLETDKKKLEKEKKKEQEEKEQLKKDLEKLKLEKKRLERQSLIPAHLKLRKIKKEDVKNLKKLVGLKNGYETFKGTLQELPVMYRLFKPDIFKDTKNLIQTTNLIELEINQYSSFNHPNIILYQAMHLQPSVGVVTEFPSNGSLDSYFGRKRRKRFQFLQKVRLFYEIANGIQYLHKKGQNHGDIRAENCFLTKELRPKLDFAFNQTFNRCHIYSQYCAPELIVPQDVEEDDEDDIEDSPHLKSDIYAFGVLMFEIVSENFNLYKIEKGKKEKIGEKVANDHNYRPPMGKLAKYYPNWFVNLIKMCWSADLERRPNISRIKTIIETIVFGDDEE